MEWKLVCTVLGVEGADGLADAADVRWLNTATATEDAASELVPFRNGLDDEIDLRIAFETKRAWTHTPTTFCTATPYRLSSTL